MCEKDNDYYEWLWLITSPALDQEIQSPTTGQLVDSMFWGNEPIISASWWAELMFDLNERNSDERDL